MAGGRCYIPTEGLRAADTDCAEDPILQQGKLRPDVSTRPWGQGQGTGGNLQRRLSPVGVPAARHLDLPLPGLRGSLLLLAIKRDVTPP